MSTFLYTRYSDRVTGTLAVQAGTEDAAYPAANLGNNQPQLPAKLTTTNGAWTNSLTAPTRVDVMALIHHNLDAGLAVALQGHASNAWGAPTVNIPLPIPPVYADKYPVNVWLNLTALVPIAANRTKQYWRLAVTGTNSVTVAVGEWAMYTTLRNFGVRNIRPGSTRGLLRSSISYQTDSLVSLDYSRGNSQRTVAFDLEATDVTIADVDTWFRDADGVVRPFLIVPYVQEPDAWFVKFAENTRSWKRAYPNDQPTSVKLQELSRGLYPTPAP